ncbi:glycosyl hydrolase family 76-domain-containing protein [Immersiella caudata]|uniref:Glycosyl hydrolase family 76-domain-containing protein n=1 Tax=Immersiella caudata TaxID=314043 RepID=A0AA40C0A9_9PEZI|nr:glycosyl hydrolase family 76-domain-containing protein [Immersiella caudata]
MSSSQPKQWHSSHIGTFCPTRHKLRAEAGDFAGRNRGRRCPAARNPIPTSREADRRRLHVDRGSRVGFMFGFAGMDMATASPHDCPSRQSLRALPSPSLATDSFNGGRPPVPSRATTMSAQALLSLPRNTFLAQWFALGGFWSNLGQTLPAAQLLCPERNSGPCDVFQHGVAQHRAHLKKGTRPFSTVANHHVTARGYPILHVTIFALLTASCIYIASCALRCLHAEALSGAEALITRLLFYATALISMVSKSWGGLVARAALLMHSRVVERTDNPNYSLNALDSVKALQGWYNTTTGLWDSTGWWNSANCLTTLADWALHDNSYQSLNITDVMANTFTKAQTTPGRVQKRLTSTGLIISDFIVKSRHRRDDIETRGFAGFLNDFYDDEGWWALAWIRSWDVTHEPKYLDMAQRIFEDMKTGEDTICGGGIWWKKDRKYKNAIANELYLSIAASLANRVASDRKGYYLDTAKTSWSWFLNSTMLNPQNLINDGLALNPDGSCSNNNLTTWSYNQGVILGGLAELSKATNDTSYLTTAISIAKAALPILSNSLGVIHEANRCEPNCGADGSQFKGVFMRNLNYLHSVAPQDIFRTAIMANANSIWLNDRNGNTNQLGIDWSGPWNAGQGPNASTHSSAMDAVVAAMTVVS